MHQLVARSAWVTHMVFVAFVALGGFLAWFLPWVLLPHLASAAWGARMSREGKVCPLSRLENWGRTRAGGDHLDPRGFIAHYLEGRVYPRRWARRMPLLVAGLVIGSWTGLAIK